MPKSTPSLEERLAHHPELQKRFEQILSIVEAEGDNLQRADEVELLVIESVRQLGHDALTSWANQRIDQEAGQCEANPALRSHGQKNSIGNPPTG
jgi:hypothetical protein